MTPETRQFVDQFKEALHYFLYTSLCEGSIPMDKITRDKIKGLFRELPRSDEFKIVCDESNNGPSDIENRRIRVHLGSTSETLLIIEIEFHITEGVKYEPVSSEM